MSQMKREDRREPRVVVLGQPHREDVKPAVTGKHGIERREIPEGCLDDLGARLHENAMHSWSDPEQLGLAASRNQKTERVFALGLLIERADELAQVIDGARACPPEDVGGPPGYEVFLTALLDNPDSEEADHYRSWVGPGFDPELFDIRAANAALMRMTSNRWGNR